MKKKAGYFLFALFFYFYRLFPIKDTKVFCIMTHDSSAKGNVGRIVQYLKGEKTIKKQYSFYAIKKEDTDQIKEIEAIKKMIDFFFKKTYHLATAKYVFMDNTFVPMAYLKFHRTVKIVQLWHGTGTIKKFGQDATKGELHKLEYQADQKITHLIVNAPCMIPIYAKAFALPLEKVFAIGLPRTDEYFKPKKLQEGAEEFFTKYPFTKGKKLLLYAPTFRDEEIQCPNLHLDVKKLLNSFSEEYMLLLRLHPFIARAYANREKEKAKLNSERVVDVSFYPDLNAIMQVSDLLITDYSSIIFEYCLQKKPIIFYAYDLEHFSDYGRGFYHPYEDYVPGPIVKNETDLAYSIKEQLNNFNKKVIEDFVRKNYAFMDGKATKRLYELIFCSK